MKIRHLEHNLSVYLFLNKLKKDVSMTKAEYEKSVNLLLTYADAYYNKDKPLVTDEEYDTLKSQEQ